MTYVEARDAVVSYFNTAWNNLYPTFPVFYENTTQVDLDKVGPGFLAVSIDFEDARRLDIDPEPNTESYGSVGMRLFVKEGAGIRGVLSMQDALNAIMKYRKLGALTLECPTPGRKIEKDGWVSHDLSVPFRFIW
jgi:hypothetical protein